MARSTSAITKTFIKEGKISYSNKDTGGLTYLGLAYNKWPKVDIWPKVFEVILSVKPSLKIEQLKQIGTPSGIQITLTEQEESKINSLLEPLRKNVISFYKKEFWDVLGADDILSQTFAESFFDFSVNTGSGTASKLLQTYLNVTADGAIGPKTLAKLNGELLLNTYNVHIDFTLLKIKRYIEIVDHNSAQISNLHGWLNRSFEVFDEVFEIEIIENILTKYPDTIPSQLVPDINKLLAMYNANKEYSLNKTSSNLSNLHKKIDGLL